MRFFLPFSPDKETKRQEGKTGQGLIERWSSPNQFTEMIKRGSKDPDDFRVFLDHSKFLEIPKNPLPHSRFDDSQKGFEYLLTKVTILQVDQLSFRPFTSLC